MLFVFRSSQVKLQNVQHQPIESEAVQSNDHEYGTINVEITRSNNVECNKEEEFSFTPCQAYETHKFPDRDATKASNLSKMKPMVNTNSGVHGREINQSYEGVTDHVDRYIEDTYEIIQSNN